MKERLLEIVLLELTTDKLKLEEKLERIINSRDAEVDFQLNIIKDTLRKITEIESMIIKFNSYMSNDSVNNEDLKK